MAVAAAAAARVLSEHLKLEAESTQRKEDACKKWAVSLDTEYTLYREL